MRASIELRRRAGKGLETSLAIYDFCADLGVEVRFVGGASFAGMFSRGQDAVFIPTERPAGRQAFTCAHELAHWHFDHGQTVEQLDFDRNDQEVPEEILANLFAGFLLMPRRALAKALKTRNISIENLAPFDAYRLACQFGVGYQTLISHLRFSERMISDNQYHALSKATPKSIRNQILGSETRSRLIFVDAEWADVAIDLAVGDLVCFDSDVEIESPILTKINSPGSRSCFIGANSGIGRVSNGKNWAQMVRVSRESYIGRGIFRHLEETSDEN